jgi:hypothetical protein
MYIPWVALFTPGLILWGLSRLVSGWLARTKYSYFYCTRTVLYCYVLSIVSNTGDGGKVREAVFILL